MFSARGVLKHALLEHCSNNIYNCMGAVCMFYNARWCNRCSLVIHLCIHDSTLCLHPISSYISLQVSNVSFQTRWTCCGLCQLWLKAICNTVVFVSHIRDLWSLSCSSWQLVQSSWDICQMWTLFLKASPLFLPSLLVPFPLHVTKTVKKRQTLVNRL